MGTYLCKNIIYLFYFIFSIRFGSHETLLKTGFWTHSSYSNLISLGRMHAHYAVNSSTTDDANLIHQIVYMAVVKLLLLVEKRGDALHPCISRKLFIFKKGEDIPNILIPDMSCQTIDLFSDNCLNVEEGQNI